MTKEIQLSKGFVALVDDEDYEFLMQWNWYISGDRRYAVRSNGHGYLLMMHNAIQERKQGFMTDHINGNGLDNRRSNLRYATPRQNGYNAKKRPNCTSQYRGVSWNKEMKLWYARVGVDGKQTVIGKFTNELEAARAFDAAARIHHGEFARLNFPADLAAAD